MNHRLRFELFPDATGSWRIRMRYPNGRVFATTEDYSAKREAEDSLASVLHWCALTDAANEPEVVVIDALGARDPACGAGAWLDAYTQRRTGSEVLAGG